MIRSIARLGYGAAGASLLFSPGLEENNAVISNGSSVNFIAFLQRDHVAFLAPALSLSGELSSSPFSFVPDVPVVARRRRVVSPVPIPI